MLCRNWFDVSWAHLRQNGLQRRSLWCQAMSYRQPHPMVWPPHGMWMRCVFLSVWAAERAMERGLGSHAQSSCLVQLLGIVYWGCTTCSNSLPVQYQVSHTLLAAAWEDVDRGGVSGLSVWCL